jgi:hypothetical protein
LNVRDWIVASASSTRRIPEPLEVLIKFYGF